MALVASRLFHDVSASSMLPIAEPNFERLSKVSDSPSNVTVSFAADDETARCL
jgi:hypothetical protein